MSKAEEARQDAEVIDALPPTYEASVAGESELYSEHDYHMVEAGPSNPDEKRAIDTLPTTTDEKNPIDPTPEFYTPIEKSQAMIPYQEDFETPPALPIRPPSLASTSFHPIPLTYALSWRRALFERKPYFDCPALTISPQNNQILPPQTPGMPSTSHWQLNYEKKYFARLHRYAPEQAQGDVPYRQVAEIQYPDFMWPNGGVKIKFEPHEEEIARRGSRHVTRTDKMMTRTGWLSAKYGIDLPVLGGSRVDWINANATKQERERGPKMTRAQKLGLKPGEVHLVTLGEVWDEMKKKSSSLSSPSDSPFPVQNLVEETSGRILATFTRARPLSKEVGRLEILQGEGVTPEYIEGIVVATAAMVGMKDRMGLMSSLIEAGTSSSSKRREEEVPPPQQPPREKEVKFEV